MENQFDDVNVLPMPLFQQVKESIRRKILDGTYAPHQKLPSERQMIEAFSVSRITIRQALSQLQRDGLIFKINGKGTFVSMPKAQFDVSTLKGFGESAASIGQEAFSKLISITTDIPKDNVASCLGLSSGVRVTRIQRLRYLNREPLAFDITYAPTYVSDGFGNADLEQRDLFDVIENDCGIAIASARVNLESMICDGELAGFLNMEPGSAALHIERTILDGNGQPLLYENLFYRGDRFRFGMEIDRAHLG